MKTKTLILITTVIITISTVLLSTGLALLIGNASEESPIPYESAVPDISDLEVTEKPASQEAILDKVLEYISTETNDGITKTVIFTEEQLKNLEARRKNGEWISLSLNEMFIIINETIDIFYNSHTIEVGSLTDGIYSVKTYNGYKYYQSDLYTKSADGPRAEYDIYDIIVARITTLNDAIIDGSKEQWGNTASIYALADAPRLNYKDMMSAWRALSHFGTAEKGSVAYNGLRFYNNDKMIFLIADAEMASAYNQGNGINGNGPYRSVQVFPNNKVQQDMCTSHEITDSRYIKVDIYRNDNGELLSQFNITDKAVVDSAFDGFRRSFDLACTPGIRYPELDPQCDYRIVVSFISTYENLTYSKERRVSIGYAYGFDNDSYCYYHFIEGIHMDSISKKLNIQNGRTFIEPIDEYVDSYFAK